MADFTYELGLALVENPAALEKYAALGRAEKQEFIDGAAPAESRSQMQAYVAHFLGN